jgi:hypothetical protein
MSSHPNLAGGVVKCEQSSFIRQLGTRKPTVRQHTPVAIVGNKDGAFALAFSFQIGNPLILSSCCTVMTIHKALLLRFKA